MLGYERSESKSKCLNVYHSTEEHSCACKYKTFPTAKPITPTPTLPYTPPTKKNHPPIFKGEVKSTSFKST